MGMTMLSPRPLIQEAALQVLADQGPLAEEQLAERLAEAGLELGDDAEEYLAAALAPERVVELCDGRLVDLVAMADGVVFSHELSTTEVAGGRVALHPDFSLLEDLAEAGVALGCAAGPLNHAHTDDGASVLAGPDGWLGPTASAGQLVTIEIHDRVTTVAVVAGPLATNPEAVAALRESFEKLNDDDDDPQPAPLFGLWLEALVADPAAFRRPQAPLAWLIAEAGLEVRDGLVAPGGFDWVLWEGLLELERVGRRWGLDAMGRIVWLFATSAYEKFATGDFTEANAESDQRYWARLASLLSYGPVAQAFLGQALDSQPDIDGSVAAFAERLMAAASGPGRAGPTWLRSVCAERDGQTLEAERLVARALAADGSYQLASEDAAWYAADRGDARRAASILRRAGVDDDDEFLALYDSFAPVPRVDVGRNQPCPCGSGRKYKHCHLGKTSLSPAEHATFLYEKATTYLLRGRHYRKLLDIAAALAGRDDDIGAVRNALRNPTVGDLALFEDHVWDEFLRDRGMLLPPDELALARQWQVIERSVHEVQGVQPGGRVSLRDARSGEVVEVPMDEANDQLRAGDMICARVLPVGDGDQILGEMEPIGRHQRNQLIQLLATHPGAVELAAWFARRDGEVAVAPILGATGGGASNIAGARSPETP